MANKANDEGVPEDEMLLAEALAAAKARNLKHARLAPFRRNGWGCEAKDADSCCALGALHLAGKITRDQAFNVADVEAPYQGVSIGNDESFNWRTRVTEDTGESLGWAFRCAMTQEEP